MKYGVAHISVIPMREHPSECAEMVSQLLFGDAYSVLDEVEKWIKIQTCDCHYEGWIDRKLYNPLPSSAVEDYLSQPQYFVRNWMCTMSTPDLAITFPVFIGSSFPLPQNGVVQLGNLTFVANVNLNVQKEDMIQYARKFLCAPYLWGGRSLAGIDCSGFSQSVYKSVGIQLPRDASQQVMLGTTIDFVAESKAGDLAFFHNAEGKIIHVGIVLDEGKIIHSSGCVRIDVLDETGIFNIDKQIYTHQLRIIKRLL